MDTNKSLVECLCFGVLAVVFVFAPKSSLDCLTFMALVNVLGHVNGGLQTNVGYYKVTSRGVSDKKGLLDLNPIVFWLSGMGVVPTKHHI